MTLIKRTNIPSYRDGHGFLRPTRCNFWLLLSRWHLVLVRSSILFSSIEALIGL